VAIASEVGDSASVVLLAPLLFTALAMRGGVLLSTWSLLTASGVAWLGYDLVVGASAILHYESAAWLVAIEALRALGNAAYCSAGFTQRLALRGHAVADPA
jgi:hypothetical protein